MDRCDMYRCGTALALSAAAAAGICHAGFACLRCAGTAPFDGSGKRYHRRTAGTDRHIGTGSGSDQHCAEVPWHLHSGGAWEPVLPGCGGNRLGDEGGIIGKSDACIGEHAAAAGTAEDGEASGGHMKLLRIAIMLFTAFFAVANMAYAAFDATAEMEEYLSGKDWSNVIEALPDTAAEQLEEHGISGAAGIGSLSVKSLWRSITKTVQKGIRQPIRILCSLAGVTLLCAMLKAMTHSFTGGTQEIFRIIISIFIATILLEPVSRCMSELSLEINQFSDFLALYIPVFAGMLTAAGQPLTGAAYNVILFGACQAIGQILEVYFVPLLSCFLCIAIVSEVCPDIGLQDVVAGIKKFLTWALGLIITVFLGLLSVQSVVASGGDSVAAKTAKYFISSSIPVVGGTLSDLFMATQGCMQLVKGTVGAFGIVAALFTFLPSLLRVLIWEATVRVGSMIAELLGIAEISRLLRSVGTVLGMIIAILLCYAMLFIVSTALVLLVFKGG